MRRRAWLAALLALAGLILISRPVWTGWMERFAQRRLAAIAAGRPEGQPLPRMLYPLPPRPAPRAAALKSAVNGAPASPAVATWPRVYARLEIPRMGLNTWVVDGATLTDYYSLMVWGPAHWIGSPAPGAAGNVVIFGHRDEFGSPFWFLYTLQPGDSVLLVAGGRTYTYRVQAVWPVATQDVAPVAPLSGEHALTLVTCTGFLNQYRLVARAVMGTPTVALPTHPMTPAALLNSLGQTDGA